MPSQLASRKGSRAGPVALSLSDGTLVDRMIKFEPSMFHEMVRCLGEARHVPALPGRLGLTEHPAIQAACVRGLVDNRLRSRYLRQCLVSIVYCVDLESQLASKAQAAKARQKRRPQDLRAQQQSMRKSMLLECLRVTRESVRLAALDHFRTISGDGCLCSSPAEICSQHLAVD